MKRLIKIQQELKVPKNQFNKFWWFNYRSCEDIIESVKPLLEKEGLALIMKDNVVQVWERYYVETVVELYDEEWKMIAYSTGYAREEESKKWMDWSQITWSSSSYSRKRALCWIFSIDDWIDSDTTNTWDSEVKAKKESKEAKWDELPRFNDPEMEQLKSNAEWVKEKASSDELITILEKKYRISKSKKQEIADYRASL